MNLYPLILQTEHIDKVVTTAFEIDPTKIYSWALGALVVLVLIFGIAILRLFKYFEDKIEALQNKHSLRIESLEKLNEMKSSSIVELKEKSLNVYRDVAHTLQLLELATKDSSEETLKEIESLRKDIILKLSSLEKLLLNEKSITVIKKD